MLYLICILVPYKGGVVYNSQSSAIFLEMLDYDKRKTYQTFASTSVYLRFLVGSAFLIFSVFCVAIFVFVLSSSTQCCQCLRLFLLFFFFSIWKRAGRFTSVDLLPQKTNLSLNLCCPHCPELFKIDIFKQFKNIHYRWYITLDIYQYENHVTIFIQLQ